MEKRTEVEQKICEMSVNEILMLAGLADVAREAKAAAELIHDHFRNAFGIGVDKIEVWGDSYNHEYLTHSGVWQARYLHQTYDVECTPDGIFRYYRAEYLIQNGYAKETEESRYTEEGELNQVVRYFRSFISRLEVAKGCNQLDAEGIFD